MQATREQDRARLSDSGFYPDNSQVRVSDGQANKLKIREFTSWSVCFAIVVVLTGLLKYLNLGITVESITSVLFYSSLLALVYFIYRIVTIPRNSIQVKRNHFHELN